MKHNLIQKTLAASEQWKNAFNQGDAQGCAALYTSDATMSAKPFGEFSGQKEIIQFWHELITKGFKEVEYFNTKVELMTDSKTILTSDWKMNNAQGIITKEIWELQKDNTMKLVEDHFEVI